MVLSGKQVAAAMREEIRGMVSKLALTGTVPTLAVLRVGEKQDDIVYENSAVREAERLGVAIKKVLLPESVTQRELECATATLSDDDSVHGVLLLRPFPAHIDDAAVCAALSPQKDVDGVTAQSCAALYSGRGPGFPPCTAQACIETLKYYGLNCSGKKAVVLGRSLVVGRAAAMLLLNMDATVTVCHSKTPNSANEAKTADILICAAGKAGMVDASYIKDGAYVLDVGINWDSEKGRLCGDCDYDAVSEIAAAASPVPGGVGAVTTVVLMLHTAQAAEHFAP